MNKEQMLPQEQPVSSVKADLSFLKKTKIFDIASSNVISFGELIRTSSAALNIEYEFFFANSLGTQWGYMKVVGGKPVKTIPLLEINVISVTKVNSNGLSAEGYLVKYCQNIMCNITDEYIPDTDVKNNKLLSHFSLPHMFQKIMMTSAIGF